MIGTTLSHYRILDELGRGGMGIVYKAEDTKLDRVVAIKVLPATALSSEDDRARFYREAKAAASLHHPNIATVFEIDEALPSDAPHGTQPSPFIAMEFIIKGQNVMLTKTGQAKVLDFGLAKTAQSTMLTRMGSTLGTAAYMSPEQASGVEVDHRSDIWSLGVMLYEMVAGRLPFAAEYEKAVMYGIMNEDPEPLTAVRTGVPMGLEWIVSKMMAKKPGNRYQSCDDLLVDLKTVDLTSSTLSRTRIQPVSGSGESILNQSDPSQIKAPMSKSSRLVWIMAVVGFLVVGVATGWLLRAPAPSEARLPQKFELNIPSVYNAIYMEVSRDGRHMVFSGQDSLGEGFKIYLYDIVSKELRMLQENIGDRYVFSPDGTRLTYRQGRMIYTIPVLGGTPTAVGEFGSGWPNFANDGSVVLDYNESFWIYDVNGGKPRQISQVDSLGGEGGHYNAWPLSDGRHMLFHMTMTTGEGRQLGILDMETGEHRRIGQGASPRYVDSGHILYVDGSSSSSGQMLLRPFDLDSQEWSGPPVAIADIAGVGQIAFDRYGTYYSTIADGIGRPRNSNEDSFVEISAISKNESVIGLKGEFTYHRVSPNGRFVAHGVDLDGNGLGDYIAVFDRETGVSQRLSLNGDSNYAAWSADGKRLYIELDSALEMWSIESMSREKQIEAEGLVAEFDLSPDESKIVYINHGSQEAGDLRILDLVSGEDKVLLQGAYLRPRFSPDGQFIMISSMGYQILVVSLSDGTVRPISNEGEPSLGGAWGKNGFIYFTMIPSSIKRIPVSTTNGLRVMGQPEVIGSYPNVFSFDLTEKGDLIILNSSGASPIGNFSQKGTFKVEVTTSWFDEAKRIAPPSR